MRISGDERRIVDLLGPDGDLRGLHAEDCVLLGPAVIFPIGEFNATGCGWNAGDGGVDALIWDIDPEKRKKIIGAIPVVDCTFVRCQFAGVGIAASQEFITRFLGGSTVG